MRSELTAAPPRPPDRRASSVPTRSGLSSAELGILLALIAIPVVLVALRGVTGGGNTAATELPAALVGTWITDAPRYAGRSLAFAPGRVVVGRGVDDPVVYRITEVEPMPDEVDEAYRIFHADVDGLVHTLEIHMLPNGTIHLTRPADVFWRRR